MGVLSIHDTRPQRSCFLFTFFGEKLWPLAFRGLGPWLDFRCSQWRVRRVGLSKNRVVHSKKPARVSLALWGSGSIKREPNGESSNIVAASTPQ